MNNRSNSMNVLVEFSDALAELVSATLPKTASVWVKSEDLSATSSGSAWSYDANHVVTNHHVVDDALETVRVRFPEQMEKIGRVVGSDLQTDLAVIRVDDVGTDAFVRRVQPPIRRGEMCMTLGSPLGEFNESVSLGVISGLNRQIDLGSHKFEEAIQTDATINPGNSGGPLIDMHGRLIGVNFLSRSDASQLNFAIPTEVVDDIVPELIGFGKIARASIGVTISAVPVTVNSEIRTAVEVRKVNDRNPLKRGDIILAINDQKISRRYDLMRHLNRSAIGTKINLLIYRDSQVIPIDVDATERQ